MLSGYAITAVVPPPRYELTSVAGISVLKGIFPLVNILITSFILYQNRGVITRTLPYFFAREPERGERGEADAYGSDERIGILYEVAEAYGGNEKGERNGDYRRESGIFFRGKSYGAGGCCEYCGIYDYGSRNPESVIRGDRIEGHIGVGVADYGGAHH